MGNLKQVLERLTANGYLRKKEKMARTRFDRIAEEQKRIAEEKKHVNANYMCDLFRRHMKKKKITQVALSKEFGCSHTKISNMLERPVGDWNIKDIRKMQKALDIPENELQEAISKSDDLDGKQLD